MDELDRIANALEDIAMHLGDLTKVEWLDLWIKDAVDHHIRSQWRIIHKELIKDG